MSIGKYHVGAMSIWQYSGHIVTGATADGSRSELSWHICHGLPEAREAVGASGKPGTVGASGKPGDYQCLSRFPAARQ